jgi:nucleotide-binding universal stress UspA family protein
MRVVVGVDGSRGGSVALRWALELCGSRGDPEDVVELVNVYGAHELAMPLFAPSAVAPPGPYGVVQPRMTEGLEAGTVAHRAELEDHYRYEAERLLDEALHDVEWTGGTKIELTAVVGEDSARALVEHAAGADLLVVGARGQSRLRTALLGSVSGYCANHAPCPVVVVPLSPAED